MEIQFLTPNDAAWQTLLADFHHDCYHLPAYAEFSERQDGGSAEAVVVSDGDNCFFLPYVLRSLNEIPGLNLPRPEMHDFFSPYGFPGPLLRRRDERFFAAAFHAWIAALRDRNIVSGFVRLHPQLNAPFESLAGCGEVVDRGMTVSIDLTQSADALWRGIRENHRRDVKRAIRKGMTVEYTDPRDHLETFTELYTETMLRVGATEYFLFSEQYFRDLIEALEGHVVMSVVRDAGGEIAAAGLILECNGITQYHLSGTRTSALKMQPTKLLLHATCDWAARRGNHTFHLGGGYSGQQDQLFNFKAGFSDVHHQSATWHIVCMDEVYDDLTRQRAAQRTQEGDPKFFPKYRLPREASSRTVVPATTVPAVQSGGNGASPHHRPVRDSRMRINYYRPSDPEWSEVVSALPHDCFHLPQYSELSTKYDGGTAEAVHVTDGTEHFFLPYILQPLASVPWLECPGEGLFDFFSPYGYPGPLLKFESEGFLREAIDSWLHTLRERNIVSGFVRMHPILNGRVDTFEPWGEIVSRGTTVSVDLTQPEEDVWRGALPDFRCENAECEAAGFTAEILTPEEGLHAFLRVYAAGGPTEGVAEGSRFSESYFRDLTAALADRALVGVARDRNGEPVFAGLFTECSGIVHAHVLDSASAASAPHAGTLLLRTVMQWARQRGHRALHIGTGRGGVSDALETVLANVAHVRPQSATWHLICLPDVYHELEQQRLNHTAPIADRNFFPSYRVTAGSAAE